MLVDLYSTSRINCQVGAVFHVYFFLCALTGHNPKARITSGWVGIPGLRPYDRAFVPNILSVGICRPGWLRPKFDIDHASHVSFGVSVASMGRHSSSKYVLMELSSFAIWDKSKVVMAISAAIWVINLGFQLISKLTSSILCKSQRM